MFSFYCTKKKFERKSKSIAFNFNININKIISLFRFVSVVTSALLQGLNAINKIKFKKKEKKKKTKKKQKSRKLCLIARRLAFLPLMYSSLTIVNNILLLLLLILPCYTLQGLYSKQKIV